MGESFTKTPPKPGRRAICPLCSEPQGWPDDAVEHLIKVHKRKAAEVLELVGIEEGGNWPDRLWEGGKFPATPEPHSGALCAEFDFSGYNRLCMTCGHTPDCHQRGECGARLGDLKFRSRRVHFGEGWKGVRDPTADEALANEMTALHLAGFRLQRLHVRSLTRLTESDLAARVISPEQIARDLCLPSAFRRTFDEIPVVVNALMPGEMRGHIVLGMLEYEKTEIGGGRFSWFDVGQDHRLLFILRAKIKPKE